MNHRRRNLDVRRAFPLVCAAPILLIVSYVIQYLQGGFKPGLLTFVPFIAWGVVIYLFWRQIRRLDRQKERIDHNTENNAMPQEPADFSVDGRDENVSPYTESNASPYAGENTPYTSDIAAQDRTGAETSVANPNSVTMIIEDIYSVAGIGTVVSGTLLRPVAESEHIVIKTGFGTTYDAEVTKLQVNRDNDLVKTERAFIDDHVSFVLQNFGSKRLAPGDFVCPL